MRYLMFKYPREGLTINFIFELLGNTLCSTLDNFITNFMEQQKYSIHICINICDIINML